MIGRIHSIESMGLLDGPGIRGVVFFQGCSLRCPYCHNPDTQTCSEGQVISSQDLVERLLRLRPYFRGGGGITFSGGEPLLQPEFLLDCLKQMKSHGVHTCLDTAGVGLGSYSEILSYTDLVLYDVKHHQPEQYQKLTGQPIEHTLKFLEAVRVSGTPLWVRHVVVPGITDQPEHLESLAQYIQTIPNVQKVELLPFHKLGAHKYALLGREDPLSHIPAMDPGRCKVLEKQFFNFWSPEDNG
jgi:pyruvate formate lyase activating enzyme